MNTQVVLLTVGACFGFLFWVNTASFFLTLLKNRVARYKRRKKVLKNVPEKIFGISVLTFLFSACFMMLGVGFMLPLVHVGLTIPFQIPIIIYSVMFFISLLGLNLWGKKKEMERQKRNTVQKSEIFLILAKTFFYTIISCATATLLAALLTLNLF